MRPDERTVCVCFGTWIDILLQFVTVFRCSRDTVAFYFRTMRGELDRATRTFVFRAVDGSPILAFSTLLRANPIVASNEFFFRQHIFACAQRGLIWQNKSASMQSDVEIVYLENGANLEARRRRKAIE